MLRRRAGRTPSLYQQPESAASGFTVIEVLVALVVVTVGMLGVAGASATAFRAATAALREQEAISTARTRLALLQAGGCAGAISGERRGAGIVVESWNVGVAVRGVRLVDARAEWDDVRQRRTVVLRSALLC